MTDWKFGDVLKLNDAFLRAQVDARAELRTMFIARTDKDHFVGCFIAGTTYEPDEAVSEHLVDWAYESADD